MVHRNEVPHFLSNIDKIAAMSGNVGNFYFLGNCAHTKLLFSPSGPFLILKSHEVFHDGAEERGSPRFLGIRLRMHSEKHILRSVLF